MKRYPTTHEVGWTWENEEAGLNVDLVLTIEVEPGEERTHDYPGYDDQASIVAARAVKLVDDVAEWTPGKAEAEHWGKRFLAWMAANDKEQYVLECCA